MATLQLLFLSSYTQTHLYCICLCVTILDLSFVFLEAVSFLFLPCIQLIFYSIWWEQLHSHLSINFVCIINNSNFVFSLTLKDNISDVCWSKIKNINNNLSSYSKIIMLFQSFLILTRASWKSQWSQGVCFRNIYNFKARLLQLTNEKKTRLLVEM